MENATSWYLIAVYAAYAASSVGLTVWIARTLFKNGAVFLEDVFADQPRMADAVNRLLVVGFYLVNLGRLRAGAADRAFGAGVSERGALLHQREAEAPLPFPRGEAQ
jgi:hypothetical protein